MQKNIAYISHAEKIQRPTSLVKTKKHNGQFTWTSLNQIHSRRRYSHFWGAEQQNFIHTNPLYPHKSTHTSRAVHLYKQHNTMFWVPEEPSGDEVWTRITWATSTPLFSPLYFYHNICCVHRLACSNHHQFCLYCLQVLDKICNFIQSVQQSLQNDGWQISFSPKSNKGTRFEISI
jgi:hypothetical protein